VFFFFSMGDIGFSVVHVNCLTIAHW